MPVHMAKARMHSAVANLSCVLSPNRSRTMRSRTTISSVERLFLSLALIGAVATCSDNPAELATQPDVSPDGPGLPGAEVARAEIGEGLAVAHRPAANAPSEITAETAESLARIWARDFASMRKDYYERDRGAPIDWDHLALCGQPTYVATPFEAPDPSLRLAVRRAVGPWWLIVLCGGGEPQLSVAVSAWNTDLEIVQDRLEFPRESGNHFIPRAIPVELTRKDIFLLSPERAAQMVRDIAGKEPAPSPDLVLVPFVMPQYARWRFSMPTPTKVRSVATNAIKEATEFYVGSHQQTADGVVGIASSSQRETYDFHYLAKARTNGKHPVVTTTIQLRPGFTIETDVVSAAGGTQ